MYNIFEIIKAACIKFINNDHDGYDIIKEHSMPPSLVGERRAYPVLRGGRRGFDPRQPRRTKRAFVPPLAILNEA
jgi:hypothetical protein